MFIERLTIGRKITLLGAIPVVAIIGFASLFLWGKWEGVEAGRTMRLSAQLTKASSILISHLQKERGQSNLYINGAINQTEIGNFRTQTDAQLKAFSLALDSARISGESKTGVRDALLKLEPLRNDVNQKISMNRSFDSYTRLISDIMSAQITAIREKTENGMGKRLVTISLFEDAKENAARLRGLMSGVLAANSPISPEQFQSIVDFHSRIYAGLESPALNPSQETLQTIQSLIKSSTWLEVANVFRTVINKAGTGEFGVDPAVFFRNSTKMVDDIDALGQREVESVMVETTRIESEAISVIWWSIGFILLFIISVVTISILIGHSIIRPVTAVAGELSQTAEQVAAASSEVAAASQQLADGASRQAAAIEQTSSSLEEMSAMTKQNAESAGRANALIKDSHETITKANGELDELSRSMEEIARVSEETFSIIKSIDAIAFQTNLLALNAAVEAARAGEVGAGFAVVADEVRNLALRATDAARSTTTLVEGIASRVGNGVNLVAKTHDSFVEVANSANKVLDLMGEISSASDEQALGVAELNKAVSELDEITQQNAATAEESAASSEELSIQARHMEGFVTGLSMLVTRSKNGLKTGLRKPVDTTDISGDWS